MWRFPRSGSFAPERKQSEVAFDVTKAFFEGSRDGGGDAAGVPVEAEDASECLEPERVGEATQHFLRPTIGDNVDGNFARQSSHAPEEPRGRAATMERKGSESGTTGHVMTYVVRRLTNFN